FQDLTALDTLARVKEQEPEQPTVSNPRVDRDVETICLKCLEKEPSKRYASAQALAEDLERWLLGQPIQARPVGRWERLLRLCRRRPVESGLACLASLLLLGSVVGLIVGLAVIQAKERVAQENLAAAETHKAALREYLYGAQMRLAFEEYRNGRLAEARHYLDQQRPQLGEPDERGIEWSLLWRMCHEEATD